MRPAFRIFLEHLTELRAAMEAHFVDALEPKWNPPSWADYVEVNRARAEGRAPVLSADRLVAHHRSMLRALVLPHRRNVPEQALPVIAAAAEVLPADDGLLRSARRRHSEKRPPKPRPDEAAPLGDEPPAHDFQEASIAEPADDIPLPATDENTAAFPAAFPETTADLSDATAMNGAAEPSPVESTTTTSADEAAADESEFEQPWTK
jgi:hypothetical protein